MANAHEPYLLYRVDESYYSGKIEAYLRYKGIPFELCTMNARRGVEEVLHNTGLQKVPAIRTNDGLWLTDSSLMIEWFEQQYPQHSVMPDDPATAFLSLLLEDYADEWCWRSAMYYRWRDDNNANYMGRRIGAELFGDYPVPEKWAGAYFKWRQRRVYLYGDGLTADTEAAIAGQFYSLGSALENVLSQQAFLNGDKPGIADFGFMGPYFRHYFCDPWPAKLLRDNFPLLTLWVTRVWAARAEPLADGQWSGFDNQAWGPVWAEIVNEYLPYLHHNHQAWQRGEQSQDCKMGEASLRQVPVVHCRVFCLEKLVQQYRQLPETARANVDSLLGAHGEFNLDVDVDSGLASSYQLPIAPKPQPMSASERRRALLKGTPWDRLPAKDQA